MAREASVERNTKETEIKLKLTLDGTGYSDIETGVLVSLTICLTVLQDMAFLISAFVSMAIWR